MRRVRHIFRRGMAAARGALFPIPDASVPEGDVRLIRWLGRIALALAICIGVGVAVLVLAAVGAIR